jgi:hypothetical protein
MKQLNDNTADRLAKLCGMFGSAHLGERAAAAKLADRLVRDSGLTWHDVVAGPANRRLRGSQEAPRQARPPATVEAKLALLRAHFDFLTTWERHFVVAVREFKSPSLKQLKVIERLVEKVLELRAAA